MSNESEPGASTQAQQPDVAAIVRDHQKEMRTAMDEQARMAAELAAARKQIEELSAAQKRAQEMEQQLAALSTERDAFAAKERARVDTLTQANAKRVETLPEAYRALVPAGLDPDAAAEQIARIEQIAKAAAPAATVTAPTIPAPRGNQLAGIDGQNTGRHWENATHPASDDSLIRRGREFVVGKGN